MRLAILGPSRHPVAEPYAGGQERFTADLSRGLRALGHHVELYALEGSDPAVADHLHPMPKLPPLSAIASGDLQLPEPGFLHDQFVYLAAIRDLLCRNDIDAVLNQSLHQLPLALSPAIAAPVITTLHTPPFPWMEVGAWLAGASGHFVAVSRALQAQWATLPSSRVVLNGVDPAYFPVGPGGSSVAWVGRMTPEKGADIAIHAAVEAGVELRLAGPMSDPEWFHAVISPLLGDSITYLGPLSGSELAQFYGSSAATLVTPRWEEPFCLVAAESQMCGTPVVGLRRGGLGEVVTGPGGLLVEPTPDAVTHLAAAVHRVLPARRGEIGSHARQHLGIARMVAGYDLMLTDLCADAPASRALRSAHLDAGPRDTQRRRVRSPVLEGPQIALA